MPVCHSSVIRLISLYGLIELKQRRRSWFGPTSKLFCGCETGLTVPRHPAAAREIVTDGWNCWEVIFTRLKSHRRLRRLNFVRGNLTGKEGSRM